MTELVNLAQSYRFIEDVVMEFPSTSDFLEEFGIEPVEVDPTLALCRYTKKSKNSELEVDISFSAVMRSFQVVPGRAEVFNARVGSCFIGKHQV